MNSVSSGVRLVSAAYDLRELEKAILASDFDAGNEEPGKVMDVDVMREYTDRILSYIDLRHLKPYKVVANTVNGPAGPVINALEKKLPFAVIKVNNVFDRSFPYGRPDSASAAQRKATADAVRAESADLGVLWDFDFGTCCLLDEQGRCIEADCEGRGMLLWMVLLELASRSHGKPVSELLPADKISWQELAQHLTAVRGGTGNPVRADENR